MWFFIIAAVIVDCVCQGVIAGESKSGGLNARNMTLVVLAASISISLGLALYCVADFGIDMYEYNKLDFYDYEELTPQGFGYLAGRVCGATAVATSVINLLVCIALGLKNTNPSDEPEKTTVMPRSNKQDIMEYPSATPVQKKVPAWMQVELEKEQQRKMEEANAAACSNCGTPRKGNGAFCAFCGKKF